MMFGLVLSSGKRELVFRVGFMILCSCGWKVIERVWCLTYGVIYYYTHTYTYIILLYIILHTYVYLYIISYILLYSVLFPFLLYLSILLFFSSFPLLFYSPSSSIPLSFSYSLSSSNHSLLLSSWSILPILLFLCPFDVVLVYVWWGSCSGVLKFDPACFIGVDGYWCLKCIGLCLEHLTLGVILYIIYYTYTYTII